jgi:hypothetical protein
MEIEHPKNKPSQNYMEEEEQALGKRKRYPATPEEKEL